MESPISAKVEVKAEVPAASTGRALDALVDIIRPLTERLGLNADMVRLQRAEVALKMAKLASIQIAAQEEPIKAVPNKGLVPLLEYASLEDADDDVMVSMWASLLANAATKGDTNLPRFVRILSELNSTQARLLERIVWHHDPYDPDQVADRLDKIDEAGHPNDVAEAVHSLRGEITVLSIFNETQKILVKPGVIYGGVNVHEQGSGIRGFKMDGGLTWTMDEQLDLLVLESLGLIKGENIREELQSHSLGGGTYTLYADWYRLTQLGAALYKRCTGIKVAS